MKPDQPARTGAAPPASRPPEPPEQRRPAAPPASKPADELPSRVRAGIPAELQAFLHSCADCGKSFTSGTTHARFCSAVCRHRNFRKRHRKTEEPGNLR